MLKLLIFTSAIHFAYGAANRQVFNSNSASPKNASQTESPWAIHITIKNKQCGGALIDDTYIVTAAHCFDNLKYSEFHDLGKLRKAVQIRIGEWKTNTDPDCGEDQSDESCDTTADILPKNITIHEGYNKREEDDSQKRYKNDIAIIKLGWPPRRSDLINPIKISGDSCEQESAGESWKTTGFGKVTIKKKSELTMMSHDECKNSIHSDFVEYFNEDHVCGMGKNGEVSCKGDGGNPVTNIIEGVPYLQGFVGYTDNEDCDDPVHTATVLVKISCFYDWIVSKVPKLLIDKPINPDATNNEEAKTGNVEQEIIQGSSEAPVLATAPSKIEISTAKVSAITTSNDINYSLSNPEKSHPTKKPKATTPIIDDQKTKLERKKEFHVENKPSIQHHFTTESIDVDDLGIYARAGETEY